MRVAAGVCVARPLQINILEEEDDALSSLADVTPDYEPPKQKRLSKSFTSFSFGSSKGKGVVSRGLLRWMLRAVLGRELPGGWNLCPCVLIRSDLPYCWLEEVCWNAG